MNRRIVIVDETVQDPVNYLGNGLGTEIYSVESLRNLDLDSLRQTLYLESGDAAMLVGSRAFEILREHYHFGIRNENYWDCSLLCRLGIEGGAFVRVIYDDDFPSPADVKFFMSPEFCKKREFPGFKYKITKTLEESRPFLDYFIRLPKGTLTGFDYESGGKAFDKDFKITGASLALGYDNLMFAVFFSFQDIEKNNTKEEYEEFLSLFREVLRLHDGDLWVFNMSYETAVTWRCFGLELLYPCDASVFNTLDGYHSKNYSLKWTAQRLLGGGDKRHDFKTSGIEPWDTEFDWLESTLSDMYYVEKFEKGKKKPVGKEFKCSEYDFEIQPEWRAVCQRYPEYIEEFKSLILENFGNPFLNMPSDILGKYCCLDSLWTVRIAVEHLSRYTPLCVETFLNNQRLFSRISRVGLYTDEEYIERYSDYSRKMMLWGILYAATYRCYTKIQKHLPKAAKIERYPPMARVLLEKNEFYKGDPAEIAKNILAQNVDPNDTYDTGLEEGNLVFKFGQKFAAGFITIVKEAMTETKFKGKIDSTVARKKKLLGAVAEKLIPFLGLDRLKLGPKHIELEKLLYYQRAYKNLLGVWAQIPDINNIPEVFKWEKQKIGVGELSEYIMENYYRCSSPVDNEALETELIETFKLETVFLATIKRDMNKLPGEKNFYKNRGIEDPLNAFEDFCANYQVFYENTCDKTGVCLWPKEIPEVYHREIWYLANEHLNNLTCDRMRKIWGDWDGYSVHESYFKDDTQASLYLMCDPWSEDDLKLSRFTLMRKLLVNILTYKKYKKILSTYLEGIFRSGEKYVIDTPQLIPLRDADPNEPGAVKKIFPKYNVMALETKRTSGPMHTAPGGHSDMKAAISCPVINTPGSRTGKTATLLSYFDIN